MTPGQKTRWAYSTTLPSPHRAIRHNTGVGASGPSDTIQVWEHQGHQTQYRCGSIRAIRHNTGVGASEPSDTIQVWEHQSHQTQYRCGSIRAIRHNTGVGASELFSDIQKSFNVSKILNMVTGAISSLLRPMLLTTNQHCRVDPESCF